MTRTRGQILVVEDNSITRHTLRLLLQRAGYDVSEARDGKEALEHLQGNRPDLVLLDLILPDIHGIELARQILAIPERSDLVILACSGGLSVVPPGLLLEAGFHDWIEKPVDPEHLLSMVRSYLPDEKAARRLFGEGRTVLVVDSEARRQLALGRKLQRHGFVVAIATNADEALEKARTPELLAVLSEAHLPGQDGFALAMAIRRSPGLSRLPVLLFASPPVDPGDRALALRLGATDLLPRTAGLQEVEAALLELLDRGPPSSAKTEENEAPERTMLHGALVRLENQIDACHRLARRNVGLETALNVLVKLSEALTHQEDLSAVFDEVLMLTVDAGGLSFGGLMVIRQGEPEVFAVGCDRQALSSVFASSALRQMLADKKHLLLGCEPPTPPELIALLERCGTSSALIVPLTVGGELRGALLVASEAGLSGDAVLFARGVASQLDLGLALIESRAHWLALVEHAPDLILHLDKQGLILSANHGGWGLPREGLLGKNPADLLPVESKKVWSQTLATVLREGTPASCEVLVARGSSEWSAFHFGPITGDRVVSGVIVVARDTTQKRQAETRMMVSDRMASVGILATGVAHEINNPLTAISTNLELARAEIARMPPSPETAEISEMLGDAHHAAGRVLEIVRDLKVFSRSEEERRGPVDLREILETTLRLAWNEIRHRARLVRDYQPVPPVEGNESRLGQVFLNLFLNAAHAIPEGNASQNELKISMGTLPDGRAFVSIRDSGVGIPPEVQPRLFTPFFTTKPVGVGTGLGLTICKRILDAHQGEISIESEVGKGTCARVTLPTTSRSAQNPRMTLPPPLSSQGCVLVIDDEPIITTAIRRILGGEHLVSTTQQAQEALEWLQSGQVFDVILCDLMMPQMTGMDFYEELQRVNPEHASRIIFLTGGAFTVRAREFLDKVPNLRLDKPFNAKLLRSVVGENIRPKVKQVDVPPGNGSNA